MDDKTLALLGDKAAQERITERGELLPCHCGGLAKIVCFEKRGIPSGDMGYLAEIKCHDCWAELRRWALKKAWAKESATKGWNTRAPMLTPVQLALLGIGRGPRKLEVNLTLPTDKSGGSVKTIHDHMSMHMQERHKNRGEKKC